MKSKKTAPKNAPLNVSVQKGQLIISIGVSTLAYAVQNSDGWEGGSVIDETLFAEDVAIELCDEQEDGSTPVHYLLDNAARMATENGSIAIALEEDERDDE